jgi:voltage-gated potassium channel
VLVIAGSQQHIDRFNELFCIYNISSAPILIVGGGNVGRSMGKVFQEREIDFRIIEKSPDVPPSDDWYVRGDASDLEVLKRAGFFKAPAVAITTHDDPTNIYLATYYRHLRPDIQVISRATSERTVETLHIAGCDFVVSYASLGANAIFNLSKRGNILMVAEGVDVFKVKVPPLLIGKSIADSRVREDCNCSIIGVVVGSKMNMNPGPETLLLQDADMVLIGGVEGEGKFLEHYRPAPAV